MLLDEVRWKPGEASDGLSWSRCGLPGSDDPFAFQTTDPTLGGANNVGNFLMIDSIYSFFALARRFFF